MGRMGRFGEVLFFLEKTELFFITELFITGDFFFDLNFFYGSRDVHGDRKLGRCKNLVGTQALEDPDMKTLLSSLKVNMGPEMEVDLSTI